jgi:hypothetical protein
MIIIMPTHWDVFGEEAEDSEQAGKRSPTSNFIQQLISVHVFTVPKVALDFWLVARLRIHLNHSIDNTVEALVLVQGERVPGDKSSSLEMTSEFMEDGFLELRTTIMSTINLHAARTATHESKHPNCLQEIIEVIVERGRGRV